MPEVKQKKKPTSVQMEMLKELRRLNDNIDEFHGYFEEVVQKQKKRKMINGIVGGLFNAFGVLLGTLIVTAIVFFVGKAIIQSQGFQDWVQTQINASITSSIDSTVDSFIPSGFLQ